MARRLRPWAVLSLIVLTGCGGSSPEAVENARTSEPRSTEPAADSQQAPKTPVPAQGARKTEEDTAAKKQVGFGNLFEAFGLRAGGPPVPDDLIPGGDCPPVDAGADAEIAAQAAALIPLKPGLTLADMWKPNPAEEFECLTQIQAVEAASIDFTMSCNDPRRPEILLRRVCRADLRSARMLYTEVGGVTVIDASGEEVAETIVGATQFSLSAREFAELKRTGATRHHYVQMASAETLAFAAEGVLRSQGPEKAHVIVNNAEVELPVIRAAGEADVWRNGAAGKGWVTALVLDDEQFPLLVDYIHSEKADSPATFRLHFPKVSYPQEGGGAARMGSSGAGELGGNDGGGEMERLLVEDKRVDVYWIYFDFNSDRIRKESEPILQEIAGILERNPEWTLGINGHTDNVGGEGEYNLNLSRRRSESVRRALVERYRIAANRLTTAGYGASAPKDTNDTPEGRAKNRRVELVRQ